VRLYRSSKIESAFKGSALYKYDDKSRTWKTGDRENRRVSSAAIAVRLPYMRLRD